MPALNYIIFNRLHTVHVQIYFLCYLLIATLYVFFKIYLFIFWLYSTFRWLYYIVQGDNRMFHPKIVTLLFITRSPLCYSLNHSWSSVWSLFCCSPSNKKGLGLMQLIQFSSHQCSFYLGMVNFLCITQMNVVTN